MEELGTFNLKINVIPNKLEKYMSFSMNNKLSVIDGFQFLSSSLDSVVKNLAKDDFNSNILDLVKQKGFMNIWVILKSLKNNYQTEKSFTVR